VTDDRLTEYTMEKCVAIGRIPCTARAILFKDGNNLIGRNRDTVARRFAIIVVNFSCHCIVVERTV